ncbi:MAG: hypothetical protein GQ574_09370 [Crocinitomix sp.]|nr:hypothetical protein [Crocinitomix sp.]
MTLLEITAAMQAYANQRNTAGAATMQGWYNNRNTFPYTRDNNNQPIPPATEAYIHVYPGIVSDTLVFFVISAYNDVSTNTNILSDIEICATSWLDPASSGNNSTEYEYAQYWINNYSTWIGNNISTIFQAFRVPQSDSSYGTIHNAMLALKTNSGATGVDSDMVVQDVDGRVIEYFDTALPVPPFPGGGGLTEADFYLYTLLT